MSGSLPLRRNLGLAIAIAVAVAGCANNAQQEVGSSSDASPPTQEAGVIVTGQPDTLDVMTWNLERFPKMGDTTIDEAARMINKLHVDFIALQEMNDTDGLFKLRDKLPGWEVKLANEHHGDEQFYNPPVAILYDASQLQVTDWDLWFRYEELPFPRPPLAATVLWRGHELTIVDVHLKAMGDNFIDESNPADEEMRRRTACNKLEQKLSTTYQDKPVILLGDMNDRIDEPDSTNVFRAFLSHPDTYKFATMDLATHVSYNTASYPKGPSQLDHILVNRPLFAPLGSAGSDVHTLTLDTWMSNGWWDYEGMLSDHRPVLLRLSLSDVDGG